MNHPGSLPPVLRALLATPSVTRLKGISQAGAPALLKPTRSVTRYEHSVGVMCLARRLGLPPQHQTVALLHDATHSAFSHTLDYLVRNAREDTHERHAATLLSDPTLTELLGSGDVAAVVAAITAKPPWLRTLDAVDYTLRDLLRAGLLDRSTARELIRALVNVEGQVCFASRDAAWSFTMLMVEANTRLYADQVDLFLHSALAELLACAVDREIVTLEDILTGDDATVLGRLRCDAVLGPRLGAFASLRPSNLRERRDGQRITSKARLFDLPVRASATEVVPLSELDPRWRRTSDAARRRAEHGTTLLTTT